MSYKLLSIDHTFGDYYNGNNERIDSIVDAIYRAAEIVKEADKNEDNKILVRVLNVNDDSLAMVSSFPNEPHYYKRIGFK